MTSSTTPPATSAPVRPTRVGVLLFDGVEPLDAIGPAQVFWSLGSARRLVPDLPEVELHLVAPAPGPVRAGYGLVMEPTATIDDCPPLDVLIVPGGTGGEESDATATKGRRFYASHRPTLDFVAGHAAGHAAARGADQAADHGLGTPITASVCTGAFILAGAGLLAGHRGNTHWAARDELVAFMAARGEAFTLEVARVVDDGAVVTAGGVSSGIELALHLVGRCFGPGAREAAATVIERETPGVA